MPTKVTDFNGGVALTSLQDSDILYFIRSGTDQFGDMELIQKYIGLIPFDVTIPSSAVLTSFTTPVEIVPNPGANKIAKLVECVQIIDFNSVAYATNVGVGVSYTSDIPSAIGSSTIGVAADFYFDIALDIAVFAGTELKANDSISFFTSTGNPTAGDSPIRFKGFYRIIDL
jgi:hypothetical protein